MPCRSSPSRNADLLMESWSSWQRKGRKNQRGTNGGKRLSWLAGIFFTLNMGRFYWADSAFTLKETDWAKIAKYPKTTLSPCQQALSR